MNRRDRERYLTKDQADMLRPRLFAAVAKVTQRLVRSSATYEGSERDREVIFQCSQGFRTDMNEQVRHVLNERTAKYLP